MAAVVSRPSGSEASIATIEAIFGLAPAVRYVAVYRDGVLTKRSRSGTENASSSDSDTYEELLVNPTVLKLVSQRGDIDCGGLEHVLIRYGHFYQLVVPREWGHVSVCIEASADPLRLVPGVLESIE